MKNYSADKFEKEVEISLGKRRNKAGRWELSVDEGNYQMLNNVEEFEDIFKKLGWKFKRESSSEENGVGIVIWKILKGPIKRFEFIVEDISYLLFDDNKYELLKYDYDFMVDEDEIIDDREILKVLKSI